MKKLMIKRFGFIKAIRKTGRIFYGLIFAVLILIAAVLAISTFNIPGNYKLLIVDSGSMEPAIKIGAIVITKPQVDYQKNDIITVSEPANPKASLTHRIVGIEKVGIDTAYITKGDANNSSDTEKRLKQNVAGKVLFSIPFLGYFVDFAKTKNGLLLLIIIPSILIICNEIINIKREVIALFRKRRYA